MSVAPFIFDVLCYLNRDQLERFSIVCRSLKNIIERYFHTKPHRNFDKLIIRGGSYALSHNDVQWHPNRDNYSVRQFLDGHKCSSVQSYLSRKYYSFTEMRPYLGTNIRVKNMSIHLGVFAYNPDHIAEMESITYLWQNGDISVWHVEEYNKRISAKDFRPILKSTTILQCRDLEMTNANFSFKDYKILYSAKSIEIAHYIENIDLDHLLDFLEQPGVKPVIALLGSRRKYVDTMIDRLSKAFSSAVVPNGYKIVFAKYMTPPFTEFCETNKTSEEKLELKKGVPIEYQHRTATSYGYYTLERSRI